MNYYATFKLYMMNKLTNFLLVICLAAGMISCKKSDPPLPDNTISFASDKQGLETTEAEASVVINLSRAADAAVNLKITLLGTGVVYGSEFTTEPAAENNTLELTIPAGGSSVSFKVKKTETAVLNGVETLDFTITEAGQPIVIGTAKMQLTFAGITSEGSQLTLQGLAGAEAGSSAMNSVFVDLSGNAQSAVKRDAWVLAFSSGSDFRVRLNNTNGTSAIVLSDKTDLNAVGEGDVTLADLGIPLGTAGAFDNIDNVYGDVSKDVIASVSATEASNKVYIVNPSGGSHGAVLSLDNLIKIRVLKKGEGYTLQYAKLKETTFKSLDLTKDAANNYVFIDFEDAGIAKTVAVEPAKTKWDFVWTWSLYYGDTGAAAYPYGFSDVIFVNNLGGVQAAEVLTANVSYEDYKESNIAGTAFKSERNVIGSQWRSTSPATGVKTDRFYVIKDASGNVYKIKFLSMGAGDGGTRGKPLIEYKLVKKA